MKGLEFKVWGPGFEVSGFTGMQDPSLKPTAAEALIIEPQALGPEPQALKPKAETLSI